MIKLSLLKSKLTCRCAVKGCKRLHHTVIFVQPVNVEVSEIPLKVCSYHATLMYLYGYCGKVKMF